MREVSNSLIENTVCSLFIKANTFLPEEISEKLEEAKRTETNALAASVLCRLCENRCEAEKSGIPLCQDTGMAVVFAEIGQDVHITGNFEEAVNKGVARAYTEGYLRKSVVTPLDRKNTDDNTPAVIYTKLVSGDKIKLTALPKGFGSENMSKIVMMNPTSSQDDIVSFVCKTVKEAGGRPCPPLVIGVGIGGTFDYAAYLAKKAISRDGDSKDKAVNELERKILSAVNQTGVGTQGFGGDVTALKVAVETYPTHIASLPVAVNISCHVTRHSEALL